MPVRIRAALLAAAALAAPSVAPSVAPAGAEPARPPAGERYDGTWSVEIVTEAGTCDRVYRYPVRVEGGRARFVGLPLAIEGGVAPSGAVAGAISTGAATARVVGRLRRDGLGAGTWSATGLFECRGRWRAERRG